MKRQLPFALVFGLTIILMPFTALAQQPAPSAAPKGADQEADQPALIPLDVQIVISRFQGEKKISSLPYALAVNANDREVSRLRMGANVPVPAMVAPKANPAGPTGPMPGPVSYRDIGTNIDCTAKATADGRFQVFISVEDTSVYTNIKDANTPTVGDMPVFRSFRSTNTLVLRDGQSRQFTAATDRISGEVVRIDVTLKVVK
jgi:hypothetical protein